jgi:hypothetical protein
MAKYYETITPDLQEFIIKQHLFFVASAPLAGDGHVNVSPKGLDCFRILNPLKVAYLDLTGSGNETSAHIHENGRITVMFCAFEGAPRILRLFGRGRTVLPNTSEWDELVPYFVMHPGARQLIVIDVELVQTSCGFAVPVYDFVGHRDTLIKWAETKGADGISAYHREKNMYSIDELPTPLGLTCQED